MSALDSSTIQLSPYVTCQECGKEFPRRSPRCTACAKPNRPPKPADGVFLHCYQCGSSLSRKSNVCSECGYAH
jgi:hypothetical protein